MFACCLCVPAVEWFPLVCGGAAWRVDFPHVRPCTRSLLGARSVIGVQFICVMMGWLLSLNSCFCFVLFFSFLFGEGRTDGPVFAVLFLLLTFCN